MPECKFCGKEIIWTNEHNPQTGKKMPPMNAGWTKANDSQEVYKWHGQKNGTCVPDEDAINEQGELAAAELGEEVKKREPITTVTVGRTAKDQEIKVMHDENTEISKAFLAEKKRYNDLYEREVIAYEKEIQMKMTEEMRRQHNIQ